MLNSFQFSKDKFLTSILDFLWRQWSTLGVAGQRGLDDDCIIDPEALLLATTHFGRYDSRLLDEVIDWLCMNGNRINIQRLRRLNEQWPIADLRVINAICGILTKQSTMRKWAMVAAPITLTSSPTPLFVDYNDRAIPIFQEPDANFLHHGMLRDPIELRGMSRAPDPMVASNLLCCVRALFGVNARSEIIAWLLTHESGHPAAIARDTGYFSKSIQHTLNEMEDSGHIRSHKDGREKRFWIKPTDWKFLITWPNPDGFPRWVDWMPIFSAITTFIDALSAADLGEASEQIQSIQLRQAFDSTLPALTRAGIVEKLSTTREQTGNRLTTNMIADLDLLMGFLK